ncbi:putative phage abortive infection protein [Pedobacter sp. R-06]|uniref:putative phage abortive infection protein n=1 Tax=Pedobacter sp. R-06 TaxID=3404051 RepID=UPI003CFB8AF7
MKEIKTFDRFFLICTICFFIIVFLICAFPLFLTTDSKFDETTGVIGDTIGGTMGPFVAIAAAFLTFLAFWVQYKANEQQKADLKTQKLQSEIDGFERTFFELVKLHRSNVRELNYSKFIGSETRTYSNRQVMRVIFQEFIECYRDVKKFSNSTDPKEYINKHHLAILSDLKSTNKISADVIEMAIIDISYSIVFFGVGIDGESVLRDRFNLKYNNLYFFKLLTYIKLKPKAENKEMFVLWKELKSLNLKDLTMIINEVYTHRNHLKPTIELNELSKKFLALLPDSFEKYYGGHQHRLGHYFRHLFQSYKFLDKNKLLIKEQKYFYGKTLRAQLSTYEQALIFINSISTLGMRWEYTFKNDVKYLGDEASSTGLITEYHLIKNLPGNHFVGITYKKYYPKVKYENKES